ncbi:MAG: AraC family transcriptional regulator [Erysipelotrichaceae bacterium]|nr:AraC family transcriptional regulator [Erysipelotrichaceae bacterium]
MANKQIDVNFSNSNSTSFKLLYVTHAKYETDWHSIMHTHPFTELFYCIKGKGKFHVENNCFDVEEDDLVIVNAGVNHTESSKESEPLEYIVVGIDGISLNLNNDEMGHYYSIHNYTEFKHEILFYIKTLFLEVKNKAEYYETISQNILEILIYNISRRANGDLKIAETQDTKYFLKYIKDYIDNHYSEDICLEKLCKISYVNKYYLVHAFKKYHGLTPINYLNEVRLEKACALLKNTDHSVKDIANFVGINSQSYLSQSFKNHFNMTPNEYRKKYNK